MVDVLSLTLKQTRVLVKERARDIEPGFKRVSTRFEDVIEVSAHPSIDGQLIRVMNSEIANELISALIPKARAWVREHNPNMCIGKRGLFVGLAGLGTGIKFYMVPATNLELMTESIKDGVNKCP